MNSEQFPRRIDSKKFFRSSRSRFGFSSGTLRIRSFSGIVPKRSIPNELVDKLSQPTSTSQGEESLSLESKKVTSSLGRLALDLVQVSDNLDRIKQVIAEDYAQTKENNRKEIEEYRKRIANRQRKIPKKDFGDDKTSLKDIIKPFVSNFFSGVGGAIRALAAFNLVDALLSGDYMQVFKSLMGIGITFIPQIGAMIAGAILKSSFKGLGKGGVGVAGSAGTSTPKGVGLGKFGAMLSLGAGALALGSSFLASKSDENETQTRLEELTVEQKSLVDQGLISITQQDLKKFQELNKKFESTLDILMGKKPPENGQGAAGEGGQTSGPAISGEKVDMDTQMRGTVTGQKFSNAELVSLAKSVGATDEEAVRLAAIAKYESGGRSGAHNDNPRTGDNSYGLWQVNMIGNLGPARRREFGISSNEELFDPVTNAQAALQVLRTSGWGAWTTNKKVTEKDLQEGRRSLTRQTAPPAPPRPPAPRRTGDEVSAAPSSGRSIVVLPIPQLMEPASPGSAPNNGSASVANVDPTNMDDIYGKLNRTSWNIMVG